MSDLTAVQKKLDSSEAEKREFLSKPVEYLEKQGVKLTPQDKENMEKVIAGTPHLLDKAVSVGVSVGT